MCCLHVPLIVAAKLARCAGAGEMHAMQDAELGEEEQLAKQAV
jgi:hypothetical protein